MFFKVQLMWKYRNLQAVCHWKTRLILLSYILKEILKKLAHQTDWRLVAVFGTFRSSNSSTLKLRSLYFGFTPLCFTRMFSFVRYLSGALGARNVSWQISHSCLLHFSETKSFLEDWTPNVVSSWVYKEALADQVLCISELQPRKDRSRKNDI